MFAKIRTWYYLLGALVGALVPVLVAAKLITEVQGNQWLVALGALGSLLGASTGAVAGGVLTKQRQAGTVASDPVTRLDAAVAEIAARRDQAAADFEAAGRIAAGQLGATPIVGPVLGPLSQQIVDGITGLRR